MQQFVYLAGPITGCSFDACVDWREYVISKLPSEIIGLSPMRGKTYLEGLKEIALSYDEKRELNKNSRVEHLQTVMSSSRGIITRDFNDCKRSHAILVNLLGATKISVGTVMEIAWAKAFSVPLVLTMEPENIHRHPMLNECAGYQVDNLDDAIILTKMLLLSVPHRES